MRERNQLEKAANAFLSLERELSDTVDLAVLGDDEGDDELLLEAEDTLVKIL